MKTIGIIAEFNPFHNGHKYLIEQAKAMTGADCCVVIMSGDFVQRGAPAFCNKYFRTAMALSGGADIVFELPSIYSLGSAELFAEGTVGLLLATEQIDHLCFGSESGNISELTECANLIEEQTCTSSFKKQLSTYIKNGLSYPSAFDKALGNTLDNRFNTLLRTPNNLLAIEYLRALLHFKAGNSYSNLPNTFTLKRMGSEHLDTDINIFSSASALRNYIISNKDINRISLSLPADTYNLISKNLNHFLPIEENDFSTVFFYRLNTLTNEELFSIPDINPDLIHKLIDFKGKKIVISDLIMSLKSKCFTYTNISRAIIKILLHPNYSKAYDFITHDRDTENLLPRYKNQEAHEKPYIRVLGFRQSCSEFLKNLRYSEHLRLITKPADGPSDNPSYRLDIFASSLYEQICSEKFKTGFTEELKTGPLII